MSEQESIELKEGENIWNDYIDVIGTIKKVVVNESVVDILGITGLDNQNFIENIGNNEENSPISTKNVESRFYFPINKYKNNTKYDEIPHLDFMFSGGIVEK